jgi:hypothetical protein
MAAVNLASLFFGTLISVLMAGNAMSESRDANGGLLVFKRDDSSPGFVTPQRYRSPPSRPLDDPDGVLVTVNALVRYPLEYRYPASPWNSKLHVQLAVSAERKDLLHMYRREFRVVLVDD